MIVIVGTQQNVDTTKVHHIGENARLECSTKGLFSSSKRWSHIPDGNKHRIQISTGDQLSPEYAGNERFRLDISMGKYDLLINDLKQLDEWVYFCTTQENEYSTRLVIESKSVLLSCSICFMVKPEGGQQCISMYFD